MNKSPAFQFYPKDFLSDINVSAMNMEERGIYITLLSYCWLEGWLPNASTKLKRICGNPSNWKESWENVRPCFYENNGKLYHKRLQKEREKQEKWREKSRLGGQISGEVRRKKGKKKRKLKGGSRVVQPIVNQSPTLQSSSSSSIPNIKKKHSEKEKYNNIQKKWNDFANKNDLPKIRELSKTRIGKINARLKEKDFDLDLLFKKIEEQPFLLGENKQGWTIDFDWVFQKNNYLKIMEMKYKNRKKAGTMTPEEQKAYDEMWGKDDE